MKLIFKIYIGKYIFSLVSIVQLLIIKIDPVKNFKKSLFYAKIIKFIHNLNFTRLKKNCDLFKMFSVLLEYHISLYFYPVIFLVFGCKIGNYKH